MFDLFTEIWQTMRNNKLRTALTGIAVAWGIFMLIVLLGMSRGVVNAFQANVGSQGSNTLMVYPGVTTEAWHGYKLGRQIGLKDTDMEIVGTHNRRHVDNVSAKIDGESQTLSTPHDYTQTYYEGVYPSESRLRGFKMLYGRFINDADIEQARKVMVLSEQTATSLFKDISEAVGSTVKFGDLAFLVVGVYETKWNRSVYIPYSTAKVLAGHKSDIDALIIELKDVHTVQDGTDAETKTRETLAAIHDFKPTDDGAVFVWNRFTQFLTMNSGMDIMNMTVWVIGIFTLLSGIIGVSNIMFVSVKERTHEIGIRRAIGAKPRSILTQIILESVVITTLFGYIGIVVGTGLIELLNLFIGETDFLRHPGVDLSITFQVTLVLILSGAMAGVFPALKALKVKPVEALRDE